MKQQNSYYLHKNVYPHSQRHAPILYNFNSNGYKQRGFVIQNYDHIEIYEIIGVSISFVKRQEFMCNISVLEVIPVKTQSSDIIFVADELGRYAFWTEQSGIIVANNIIRTKNNPISFYKDIENNQSKTQYHGLTSTFSVFDTQGNLFFTVDSQIIYINFVVRKGNLKVKEIAEFQIPYTSINYIGIIESNTVQIGIVQQRQERTILHLHHLGTMNCLWSVEKNNLKEFVSFNKGQIITITNNQISILKQKHQNALSTYKINQPGHIKKLDEDKYIYIGESASQLIVFGKKKVKNYGSFMLESDVCLEIGTYGMFSDGGYLISVVDQGYTIQFIVIYESTWKSIKTIPGMSSIFTLQQLNKKQECLAVTKVSDSIYQVGVITNRQPCKMIKQSKYQNPITNVFSVEKGKYVILCKSDYNSLLKYNYETNQLNFVMELMDGKIKLATDTHIVTQEKIYSIKYDKEDYAQIVEDTAKIVSACCDGEYIGFFCKNYCYKIFNTKTNSIDRIRKDCASQYYWHFHGPQILLVADYQQPGSIIQYPIFNSKEIINLKNQQIIVSIESKGELVLISYINAKIDIYSFNERTIIKSFEALSEPLKLMKCNESFLAIGSAQAFYLQFEEESTSLRPIQFDAMNQISLYSYLQQQKKMLIFTNQSAKLFELPVQDKGKNANFRIVSVHLTQNDDQPPFALVPQNSNKVYIASKYEILIKNIYTSQVYKKQTHILKQINCIQEIEKGILVGGVDDMDYGQVMLFGLQDLQIISVTNLGQEIPGNIKRVNANTFIVRHNTYVMMYQLNEKGVVKQKFKYKTNLSGYTLAANQENNMVVVSDPLKYLVAFNYKNNNLLSLCRYSNYNMINYLQFLENSVICGDCAGYIQALQFNMDCDDIHKTLMTGVGGINLGTQILMINKANTKESVIYCTLSGYIGKVYKISQDDFKVYKEAQRIMFKRVQETQQLKYRFWRQRQNVQDKFIDTFLVKKYLVEGEKQSQLYQKVLSIQKYL